MTSFPKKTYITFLLMAFFFAAVVVVAQEIPIFEENIQINISPKRPGSEEGVRVSIESFLFDTDRSTITWSVDGTVLRSGIGRKEFSFVTGNVGETTILGIDIETPDGLTVSKRIPITPAEVELVWEADSYTPPLYKGKALHSSGGGVRIVALPNIVQNGSRVATENLIYTWRRDNTVLGSQSGFGKNILDIAGSSLGKPISVGVVVETPDGAVAASENIVVPIVDPFVVLYENDPILGTLFGRALSGVFSLSLDEIVVEAYPYHFSVEERDDTELNYRWGIGGKTIRDGNVRETIVLRHSRTSGTAGVFVSVRNAQRVLQSGSGSFTIQFEE